MARTFGAATSDRVTVSLSGSTFGNSSIVLYAGWYFPTTLTTQRRYWGVGATTNLAVGSTTSEAVLSVARASTTAVYTSSGLGVVTNVWQFICVIASISSTGNSAVRMWRGTLDGGLSAPITPTTTTVGLGNATAGSTIGVGNAGLTQNQSFQGDIDNFYMMSSFATVGGNHPFGISSAYGTLTTGEVERLQNLFVSQLYGGSLIRDLQLGPEQLWFTLDSANISYYRPNDTLLGPISFLTVTNSGTTLAGRRCPVQSNVPLRSCAGQRCRR